MRSGLRGGGSGGSDAAMVGPAARPFICIPPHTTEALPVPVPVTELSLCVSFPKRSFYASCPDIDIYWNTNTSAAAAAAPDRPQVFQLPQFAPCAARSNILTTLQRDRRNTYTETRDSERERHAR